MIKNGWSSEKTTRYGTYNGTMTSWCVKSPLGNKYELTKSTEFPHVYLSTKKDDYAKLLGNTFNEAMKELYKLDEQILEQEDFEQEDKEI